MKFEIPKDYQAPDGVKEGEPFQEMATFSFDGKHMTLISIGEDEAPVGEDDEKKEMKESKKPKGGIQAIREQLNAGDSEGEM